LYWHDLKIEDAKLSSMKGFQRVNHFPAMTTITQKGSLAHLLKQKRELYPADFTFFP
jgi:hypothetical protein